jgi:hypothetical protein
MMTGMTAGKVLDREEYIEQAYFFRVLRERLASESATQIVLAQIDQEILSTTRLPYAIQFLASELKHTGLLSSGFTRLAHYFAPFQAFVIRGTEEENRRFSFETGLLVLEREAEYRSREATPQGLFIYQFEVMCRNRLGYDEGLRAMAGDPFYDDDWRHFLDVLRRQVGVVDFAEVIYQRSAFFLQERKKRTGKEPSGWRALFGEKEGKIARANRDKDPLFLFAALQRQLNYPEVPRGKGHEDTDKRVEELEVKMHDLELRLKLLEAELRGQIDLSQFGKPDLLKDFENPR